MTYEETSIIKLYKNCPILPDKNFKVDDLGTYLSGMTGTLSFSSAQMIKQGLKINVKIQLDQNKNDLLGTYNYNYCEILNVRKDTTPTETYGQKGYYFVLKRKWLSMECVELELQMDVLNTLNGYVSINEKTQVYREHKNRWKASGELGLYLPVIDFYSEEIIPPLFKQSEDTLDDGSDSSYYLVYKSETTDEGSPIHLYLFADYEIPVNIDTTSGWTGEYNFREHGIKNGTGLTPNMYGIIYGADTYNGHNNVGVKFRIKFYRKSTQEWIEDEVEITATNQCIIFGEKKVLQGTIDANGFTMVGGYQYANLSRYKFEDAFIQNLYKVRTILFDDYPNSYWTPTHINEGEPDTSIYVNSQTTIPSIDKIDRTNPLLLKIIKLPYNPIKLSFSNSGVLKYAPSGWKVVSNGIESYSCLEYIDVDFTKCLGRQIELDSDNYAEENPYTALEYEEQNDRGKLISRNIKYETKLRHSDYFYFKFVYDSFAYTFKSEMMETDGGSQLLYVQYDVSLTMSSRFMFRFPFTSFDYGLKIDNQDYSSLVYVARNNELPLFNSEYINYIKTGYNYDVKTRNRQLASSIVGGVLSTGGAIISALTGNPLGVAGAVGLGITAVQKFTSTAFNTAQADQNIAQKLKTAEYQGLSIAGSDDIDLMTEYTDSNKAKLVKYQCSERMQKALYDLFYYCGYIAGYQAVPNETSRKVFNFVQADIVFNTIQYNVSQEILDEYKSKYHDGVTIIHHYTLKDANNDNVRGWDFAQQYENWETTIS